MRKLGLFLLFLAAFNLFLGCGKTFTFHIYQGLQPEKEVKEEQKLNATGETQVQPHEPISLTAGEGSSVIYIYIFSDAPTTVTTPIQATVPISPFTKGEGQK
jgi:hypothetical protein